VRISQCLQLGIKYLLNNMMYLLSPIATRALAFYHDCRIRANRRVRW